MMVSSQDKSSMLKVNFAIMIFSINSKKVRLRSMLLGKCSNSWLKQCLMYMSVALSIEISSLRTFSLKRIRWCLVTSDWLLKFKEREQKSFRLVELLITWHQKSSKETHFITKELLPMFSLWVSFYSWWSLHNLSSQLALTTLSFRLTVMFITRNS